MTKRIINLGGGTYNANIEGDYIQGEKKKEPEPKMKSAQPPEENTINTNGANYTESLGGEVIKGDRRGK